MKPKPKKITIEQFRATITRVAAAAKNEPIKPMVQEMTMHDGSNPAYLILESDLPRIVEAFAKTICLCNDYAHSYEEIALRQLRAIGIEVESK